MAQVTGAVVGLSVTPSAASDEDDDDTPLTEAEQLCRMIITRERQGYPKAALAAAVDLVNHLAAEHGLGGGAFL